MKKIFLVLFSLLFFTSSSSHVFGAEFKTFLHEHAQTSIEILRVSGSVADESIDIKIKVYNAAAQQIVTVLAYQNDYTLVDNIKYIDQLLPEFENGEAVITIYLADTGNESFTIRMGGSGISEPVEIDFRYSQKYSLELAIDAALSLREETYISDDASKVNIIDKWVTQTVMDNFDAAIAYAEAILESGKSMQDFDLAAAELDKAVNIFTELRRYGEKSVKPEDLENRTVIIGTTAISIDSLLMMSDSEILMKYGYDDLAKYIFKDMNGDYRDKNGIEIDPVIIQTLIIVEYIK